jgi:hypothetical protein
MSLGKSSPSPSPSATTGESDALNALIQSLAGSSTGTGGDKVYMGLRPSRERTYTSYAQAVAAGQAQISQNYTSYAQAVAAGKKQAAARKNYMSTYEALASYDNWTTKKQDDFLAKLKISGLVQSDAGPIEAYKVWEALVNESARKTANGQDVSPFDILGSYVSQAGGTGKGAWVKDASGKWETNAVTGERRYVGPRFSTTTDSRIDYTDPATARAIATKMFQDMMGRDPGKGELSSFGSALSAAEASNPTVATTTTEYNTTTGEAVGSSTVSKGGVAEAGKEQLAEEQIKGKKEYGATQAATTYMNALENAVYGAPG